jgi:CrcB protein
MRVALFILGAGIGAPARFLIDRYFRSSYSFPVGILAVNIVGSFILGLTQLNYFVLGLTGAFTTWSAFALDVNSSKNKSAVINIVLTFTLSILAVYCGISLAS